MARFGHLCVSLALWDVAARADSGKEIDDEGEDVESKDE